MRKQLKQKSGHFAEREEPTGKEINMRAADTPLDQGKRAFGRKQGKTCTFTPANLSRGELELEKGVILGQLDTALPGEETSLAPGRYNLFLANVGGKWRAYAESGGVIVAEAARVFVGLSAKTVGAGRKPVFYSRGWCWEHTFRVSKYGVRISLRVKVCI